MNNKKPDKKEIENKLNLVIDKLMNLGRPDNDEELEKGGESIGFFKRDFYFFLFFFILICTG